MRKIYEFLICFFIILFPVIGLASQVVISSYSTDIVGDFGPRRIIENHISRCDFHKGVDLRGAVGTTFPLIQNGKVKELKFTNTGGSISGIFYVRVDGDKQYRYMHLFSNVSASNSLPIHSGNFTLVKTTESDAYAIIYWSNKNEYRAKYILSAFSGETVIIDKKTVIKATGDEVAVTINELNTNDNPYIGPIGKSGCKDPHMHIDMGINVNINPLNYISHDNAAAYEIDLWDKNNKTRDESWVISDKIADSYYLKITVTSKETLNLDKVLIYVDSATEKNLLREYSYGGRAGENPLNTLVENGDCSDGLKDGVYSVDLDGNGESDVGNERFIFSKWADSKDVKTHLKIENLSAGNHSLIMRAVNIYGQVKTEKSFNFKIIPKDYVLYRSGITAMPTPTPGGTPNPFAHFDTVILKDMKLKPTEQPDEAGDDTTPEATPVATETPVPEIKSVNIHDYIKGIMYAATGSANFKGDEYKNGYKAIGIAAYTLLLREIGGNSDFDVLVNGYTTSQKHFIAYKDYSQAPSDIKRAIDNAYDEIVVSVERKLTPCLDS